MWSDKDVELLRHLHHSGLKWSAILKRLGKSDRVVRRKANLLGLVRRQRQSSSTRVKVAEMHAKGMNDCAIAEVLGITCRAVQHHRKDMELPPHPARVEKRRIALQRTLRKHDTDTLASFRDFPGRLAALEEGFPAGTTPAQADILRLLRRETLTASQIAGRLRKNVAPVSARLCDLKRMGAIVGSRYEGYRLVDPLPEVLGDA